MNVKSCRVGVYCMVRVSLWGDPSFTPPFSLKKGSPGLRGRSSPFRIALSHIDLTCLQMSIRTRLSLELPGGLQGSLFHLELKPRVSR